MFGEIAVVATVVLVVVYLKNSSSKETTIQDRALLYIRKMYDPNKCTPRAVGQLTVVLYFEKAPDLDKVKALMCGLLVKNPRMRAFPIRSTSLKKHGFAVSSEDEAKALVEARIHLGDGTPTELADIPLPKDQLWGMDIVENAVIIRVDHSIGDGLRLMGLASEVLRNVNQPDQKPTVAALRKLFANKEKRQRPPLLRLALDASKALVMDRLLSAETAPIFHKTNALLPQGKRIHAGDSIGSIADLKMLSKKTGSTINDILTSALCASLADFASTHGTTRAMLAVAAPLKKKDPHLGDLFNNFFMPSLDLPVVDKQYASRSERLKETTTRLQTLKKSTISFWLVKIASLAEALGADALITESQLRLFTKHSCVISNVPGYDHPVTFAGRTVTSMHAFFPNIITQILFVSYQGQLSMTVSAAPDFQVPVQDLLKRVSTEISDWLTEEDISPSSSSSSSM